MSLEKVHLRRLLTIFFLPDKKRTAALRRDIYQERKKQAGGGSGGGDFHAPFWTDAKNHVAGKLDLRTQSTVRIGRNSRRGRLYPQLTAGFLSWWDEKRRWRNEPFEFLPENVGGQLRISELSAVVKIENLLALDVGDQSKRIIYPYFSEGPTLTMDGARLGLWALSEVLPDYRADDFRVLDILRGASFGQIDCPFRGNERELFVQKYGQVLREWKDLQGE